MVSTENVVWMRSRFLALGAVVLGLLAACGSREAEQIGEGNVKSAKQALDQWSQINYGGTTLHDSSGQWVVQKGFHIKGAVGAPTAKAYVAISALGPSLSGGLADPTMTLKNGNGWNVRSNDNWADDPGDTLPGNNTVSTIATVGHAPGNALESGMLIGLVPDSYTLSVTGHGLNLDGMVMPNLWWITSEFISIIDNVSVQGYAGLSPQRLTTKITVGNPGIGVAGDGGYLYIRALGPSLAGGGQLPNPKLTVTNASGSIVYAINDDWQTTYPGQPAQKTTSIKQTGLQPTNDYEAALLIALPENTPLNAYYNVYVDGVGTTNTGLARLEVYDTRYFVTPSTLCGPHQYGNVCNNAHPHDNCGNPGDQTGCDPVVLNGDGTWGCECDAAAYWPGH